MKILVPVKRVVDYLVHSPDVGQVPASQRDATVSLPASKGTIASLLSVTPEPARLTAELRRVCKPGGDIFVLNHFSGGNAVWAPLERLVSGLAARIGFRSEFPFAPHMQHPDWTVLSVRKVNLLGLTTLVHLKNQPAG